MPIKGLTDRRETSFPKIGDVRKGGKRPDDKHIGKDLTYFRVEFGEHEAEAAARFLEVYGAEPREINVMLPFAEIDRNFEAWQEAYTAGALQHRCDGETCVIWRDPTGELHHEPKPCPGGCVPVGRLKIIIPELRRLAYVVVHTTSRWDIVEITANLEALSRLTGNGVNGIPLVLKRRPRQVSTPAIDPKTHQPTGKRVRREKWMLSIEADPAWVDAQIGHMRLLSMPGGQDAPPSLAAGADLLTGEIIGGDDDDLDAEDDGDWGDDPEDAAPEMTAPPEPEAELAAQTPPEVQAAMDYTTKAGKRLGQMSTSELNNLLDWCNAHADNETIKEPRHHIETLLAYMAGFEQPADDEQETLL